MALKQDAATGLFLDDRGNAFVDPAGTIASTDPSLNAQAQRSLAASNALYAKLAQYQQNYQQANQGQTQLGTALDKTISGAAPSVAQTSLDASTDQIGRNLTSEAAGATGENAGLARYAAIQGTGTAQAQAAGDAARLRAQEVAQAEQAKGTVLGQQAGEAGQFYGNTLSGATGAGNTAEGAGATQGQINEQESAADKALAGNLLSGAGSAATTIAVKSDPAVKTDMHGVSDAAKEQLMEKLKLMAFNYKDPGTEGEPGGQRAGLNAKEVQDGGPLGEHMVIDGKPLKLDVGNSLGVMAGLIGYLHDEVAKLKGGKK